MPANYKAVSFSENLWRDLFWFYIQVLKIDIENSREEEAEKCMPDDFYCDIITLSKDILLELKEDIYEMPALLLCSDEFFKTFSNSVCLKLISNNGNPEVAFLKVMGFLLLVTSVSLVNACYRPIYDLPTIFGKLLQEHMKTKFYIEDRFDEVSVMSEELAQNEHWLKSTVGEIRICMKESLETELPAIKIHSDLHRARAKLKIVEIKSRPDLYKSEYGLCRYCNVNCISFLKQFFGPKIRYKSPELADELQNITLLELQNNS